ncbi:MAG: thiamine pyrophosphate-binding protein [Gammaproteobacteria bacterium]|nr:thiamine pyrophosphate-binding protein [Gammaproteobacteria bacterium]
MADLRASGSTLLAERIATLSPAKRRLLRERMAPRPRSGSDMLAGQLAALGISHVYTITGVPIDRALACCAARGIRLIGVRDQRSAALMALAQNYHAGRLAAAVMVSAGPAVTNVATAIHTAQANCWPLLVIGGCAASDLRGMGEFQELDGAALFASIAKSSVRVPSLAALPRILAQACATATSGRPGPVYLDVPSDVLQASADDGVVIAQLPACSAPLPNPAAVRRAAELLAAAKRPLMVIGKGVRWSEPCAELARLADVIGIPFVASPMGRGFLPDTHPRCCNALRSQVLGEADVVLLLGARLDWTFRFGSEVSPNAMLIQVDIEAQEIGRNVAAAVGIVADVREALRQLLAQLEGLRADVPDPDWIAGLQRRRDERQRQLAAAAAQVQPPLLPLGLIAELGKVLPEDAVCILDGATILAAGQQLLPALRAASRYTPGSNGCLGSGIPFAIGAKLQAPQRLVVAVCGDLAVGFSLMELETAARYGLPIVVVIANNQGPFGLNKQQRFYPPGHPDRVAACLPEIRYEQMCVALGGHGEFVDRPEQFRGAWERALASGKPACINVIVDPYAPYPGRD